MINSTDPSQTFSIRDNLLMKDSHELLSWLRYFCFDDEES